jgi:nucleoside-diphosphate-sugar epimerase
MRVFVTGATGFIGTHVVPELIAAGHKVLGMARSDDGARSLAAMGAEVLRGTLEDIESLKNGAAGSEAVIHLAFNHDFSKFKQNGELDKRAIEAMGSVLASSDRPLIVTAGVAGIATSGQLATEDMDVPANYRVPRLSEQTALSLIPKGVRASVVRLPQVHDTVKQGLITWVVAVAREKTMSAYIGDGTNRWAAAHVSDVARLYRLALEKNEVGAKYHAVDEEGVALRDIAEVIGRRLKIPVKSIPAESAPAHFGFLAGFIGNDLTASSALTRNKLGWNPTGPKLLEDLQKMDYSKNRADPIPDHGK